MEWDLVIDPAIVAVVLCIVCGIVCGIIILCWYLSQTVPQWQVPQWQVPEYTAYLQGVALRRSQAPEFYDFIQNVIYRLV